VDPAVLAGFLYYLFLMKYSRANCVIIGMNSKDKAKLMLSILAALPVLMIGIDIIQNSPKSAIASSIAEVRN
jgi:hypothetical protein